MFGVVFVQKSRRIDGRRIGSSFKAAGVISKVTLVISGVMLLLATPLGQRLWGEPPGLFAQEPLSGREILERVAAGQAGLQDFVADSQVEVRAPGVKWPRMKLRVYFKSPDKVHVESDRLALVPAGNLVMPDARRLLAEGVEIRRLEDVKTVVPGTEPDRAEYQVLVAPGKTHPGKQEGVLRLTVDSARWLITRALMQDPAGGEMEVLFSYTQVGEFWLPASIKGEGQLRGFHQSPFAKGTGSAAGGASSSPGGTGGGANNPASTGEGTETVKLSFTVSYTNYRVNTGLSDKIFESRK